MEKPPFDGYHSSRGYYTGSDDGEHKTIGAKADLEAGQDLSQPWGFISLLKAVLAKLRGILSVQLAGSNAQNYEVVIIDSTVGGVGLTAAKYGVSQKAIITVETAQIRFRVDGGAPTTTLGHVLDPGGYLELDTNQDIAAFRAIRTGSTSGTLQVTYAD